MDRKSERAAALEQRIARMLAGTAEFKAPQTLEARVLKLIERRVPVPWWQRRVPEWPYLAQLLFALTGIAAAAALLLARPATPKALGTVISQPLTETEACWWSVLIACSVTTVLGAEVPEGSWLICWIGGLAMQEPAGHGHVVLPPPGPPPKFPPPLPPS